MKKIIPETLEGCKAELERIYRKKRVSKKQLFVIGLILVAFLGGFVIGDSAGYHQALIDFGIIAGTVI